MADVTYEDYQDLVRKLSLANERVRDLQERVSGREAHIAALKAQLAARTGGMKVKPLYLSNLLRHAFFEGVMIAGGSQEAAAEWWPEYDPETCAAYSRILSALEPAAMEGQQPVAYPKIMYCCEYCREHSPETCGYDRTDTYVMPDGRWLCGDCASEDCANDQPVDDLPHPPLLYTRPSEQAVTEALKAALETMNRYCRAGYGDDVFMDDLCRSIRKAESALKAAMEAEE